VPKDTILPKDSLYINTRVSSVYINYTYMIDGILYIQSVHTIQCNTIQYTVCDQINKKVNIYIK